MSRTDELALEYACPYCQASPGEWCVTRARETRGWAPSDRATAPVTGRSPWLHSVRTRPIMASWRDGYGDGLRDGHNTILEKLARIIEGNSSYTGNSVAEWLRGFRG